MVVLKIGLNNRQESFKADCRDNTKDVSLFEHSSEEVLLNEIIFLITEFRSLPTFTQIQSPFKTYVKLTLKVPPFRSPLVANASIERFSFSSSILSSR